jgi:hypothetical protein
MEATERETMRTYDIYRLPDPGQDAEQIGQIVAGSMLEAWRLARAKFPEVEREQLSIDEAADAGEETIEWAVEGT